MNTVLQPPQQRQASSREEGGDDRLSRILPLLACPACRGRLLRQNQQALHCADCAATYPVRDGVPILLPTTMQEPGVGSVDADDPVSRHPYSPKALEIIEEHASGWVLDLGAGGKLQRWDNVLQVDIFRYPMTDVVATADCLPFRDNAFSAVVSQAVFEHLQYPEAAAAEIRRALQPHGTLRIDTAFLQPEHGYPHHFYNATETGLRHWFRDFDIQWSGVDTYQHPKWALSWFLDVYLDRLPSKDAAVMRQAAVGQVNEALRMLAQGRSRDEDEKLLAALNTLPQHELRTLAAGVCIQARNPPKTLALEGANPGMGCPLPTTTGTDREMQAMRQELLALREQVQTLQEARVIAVDRGNYLAQVAYFNIDTRLLQTMTLRARLHFAAGAILRLLLPPNLWLRMRAARQRQRSAAGPADKGSDPFFTVVVVPREVTSLIKAFFSLTHQGFTGWELVVVEYPGQPVAVRNVLRDFMALDRRVHGLTSRTESTAEQLRGAGAVAQGQYLLNLPPGTELAQMALQTFYTLLRDRPDTSLVLADHEYAHDDCTRPMRCHAGPHGVFIAPDPHEPAFALHAAVSGSSARAPELAYVPEALFRQSGRAE